MNKIIVALLTLALMVGTVFSASVALADTATAKDGDLIYEFDFRGEDGVWESTANAAFDERYTATISEDGSTIRIKSCDETQWDTGTTYRYYGAKLANYKVNDGESYTFVYQAKKNGTVGENALCIGNVYLDWNPNQVQGIKGWFTTDQAGAQVNAWINYGEKAVKTTFTDYDVDEDGFMTIMTVIENVANSANVNLSVYALKADGNVNNDADWMKAFTFTATNASATAANDLAFFVGGSAYTHKLDTTIRNARLYYGAGYGDDRKDITEDPTKEGYVFAGWYEDAAYTTPLSSEVTTGKAYAKYVDEDVLSVKFQIMQDTTAVTPTTGLRLVTTVDSLEYSSVGFKVEVNGVVKLDRSTQTVYQTIFGYKDGEGTQYKPILFSTESAYFVTHRITDIPNVDYDTPITVTPYWTTLDGTVVTGVARTVTINQMIAATAN